MNFKIEKGYNNVRKGDDHEKNEDESNISYSSKTSTKFWASQQSKKEKNNLFLLPPAMANSRTGKMLRSLSQQSSRSSASRTIHTQCTSDEEDQGEITFLHEEDFPEQQQPSETSSAQASSLNYTKENSVAEARNKLIMNDGDLNATRGLQLPNTIDQKDDNEQGIENVSFDFEPNFTDQTSIEIESKLPLSPKIVFSVEGGQGENTTDRKKLGQKGRKYSSIISSLSNLNLGGKIASSVSRHRRLIKRQRQRQKISTTYLPRGQQEARNQDQVANRPTPQDLLVKSSLKNSTFVGNCPSIMLSPSNITSASTVVMNNCCKKELPVLSPSATYETFDCEYSNSDTSNYYALTYCSNERQTPKDLIIHKDNEIDNSLTIVPQSRALQLEDEGQMCQQNNIDLNDDSMKTSMVRYGCFEGFMGCFFETIQCSDDL